MRRTLGLFKYILLFSSFIAFSAHAESPVRSADTRDAQSWLRKMQAAAQKLSYSGTFIYQQGNDMRTSRITHVADETGELERLELLDGKPKEYFRSNDEIVCYLPESKTVLVEKRITQDVFPAILGTGADRLVDHYTIRDGSPARIAGFEAQSILLEPEDDLRYGYRLWAEKNSGLLLRAQTVDENGAVVEQISFTQLSIGNVDRKQVKPGFGSTRDWRIEKAVMSPADLSGWSVARMPPGFRRIREVRRAVSDTAPANSVSAQREISQIVYSDGLAAISIFIEPGSQSRTEGWIKQGAMNIIGKRYGNFWLTIVGEVPSSAIRRVADSIEYKSSK
ncbi:MucB/RseB C-terminal domain-containing protein [Noviherbaspirillum pedocola]|uniref:MucB/RseB C-terminal domain-containing protein n=1 Tax=Noviherbaspirillum pedocola TaxID=2801341 RepID=A0A934SRP2_9BURK|nr:MucB/RseB C-terminal domain-containing protein [Noviherbaspirillum pedocola]MBK4734254.1 MucB/RseB C-terminal domain-containing protein [Noviherbaspirillum pedocola]